ncbi:MAG: hypothetical protein ABI678_22080 [Kofleriaceae bacterium]
MSTDSLVQELTSPTHDLTSLGVPHEAVVAYVTPLVGREIATSIVESCRIWARGALLVRDVAVDREPVLRGHDAVAAHACQFDALMRLSNLVGSSRLWTQLERLLVTTLEAIAVEVALREGRRDLAAFDLEAAARHAQHRNAVCSAWIYAVAAAAPGFETERVETGYRHLLLAIQAMHDGASWKVDRAIQRPSLVVAGTREDGELARTLIAGGRLRATYQLALAEATLAREELGVATPFTPVIADLERRARAACELLPVARA